MTLRMLHFMREWLDAPSTLCGYPFHRAVAACDPVAQWVDSNCYASVLGTNTSSSVPPLEPFLTSSVVCCLLQASLCPQILLVSHATPRHTAPLPLWAAQYPGALWVAVSSKPREERSCFWPTFKKTLESAPRLAPDALTL